MNMWYSHCLLAGEWFNSRILGVCSLEPFLIPKSYIELPRSRDCHKDLRARFTKFLLLGEKVYIKKAGRSNEDLSDLQTCGLCWSLHCTNYHTKFPSWGKWSRILSPPLPILPLVNPGLWISPKWIKPLR